MITTAHQALLVQQRRVANGKRGYSKAVRTYLKENAGPRYLDIKMSLPVNWHRPKKAKQETTATTIKRELGLI